MRLLSIAPALLLVPALGLAALARSAAPQPARSGAAPAAEEFAIDGVHSHVIFKVKHLDVSWAYGRFNDVSGTFTFDAEDASKSKLSVTVDAGSIDTQSPDRDKHLRSPDFFSVKEYPSITFESKRVEQRDEDEFVVLGELSMRGVKKQLEVQLKKTGEGDSPFGDRRMGFHTNFRVKRADFGITYGGNALGEEVEIIVSIEGARPKR